MLLASGLAALRLKPRDLLQPLGRAAVEKLETFGAVELSTLLGSLTTLRYHDLSLLRASAARLPEVVSDMNPRALCEMAAAFAAADKRVWIPSALDVLAEESVAKARLLSQPHAWSRSGSGFGYPHPPLLPDPHLLPVPRLLRDPSALPPALRVPRRGSSHSRRPPPASRPSA